MKGRTKLWLIMLIGAVSSLVLFILLSNVVGSIWVKGYNLNKLNAISHETLNLIDRQSAFDKDSSQPLLDSVRNQHPDLRLEWIASDGTVIYDTLGQSERYDFTQLAYRMMNMPNNLWGMNEPVTLVYSLNQNGLSYYLLLGLPSEAMQDGQYFFYARTNKVIYTLILPFLLAALVPYLLSIWFFSSFNRRIGKLNKALNQVNIRSEAIVLQDKSKDEIGQLTQHYNEMAYRIQSQTDQIKQFEKRRKQLLSNLSHDLRTPLTMILGYAETIRAGAYNNENKLQHAARIILQRSRYMDNLLDQLLNISQQEEDCLNLHFTSHSLSEMMRRIVADYMMILDGQGFTIEVNIPDTDVMIDMDKSLIERALRNLLDNAIRHGNEGQFLGVGLTEKEKAVYIVVKDRGRGIAPENYGRIFESSFHIDEGRHGVGLSIVREIAESHQGSISLSSDSYKETLFQIRLPKKQLSSRNES